MDSRTGDLYSTKQAALDNLVPEEHVVEVRGTVAAIKRMSRAVRATWKRRRKLQKASRRRNR